MQHRAERRRPRLSSHRGWRTACRQSARCKSRPRSEEHTSELQSQSNLVCRLLLEKKKQRTIISSTDHITKPAQIEEISVLTSTAGAQMLRQVSGRQLGSHHPIQDAQSHLRKSATA